MKNYCKTEKWSFKEISDAIAGISSNNSEHSEKKIVIPRFQRGKRWTESQQNIFFDSIKNGYPVGTLLFYKTSEIINGKTVETYSLVDGLQRSTAIHKYISNPMVHYKENEVNNEMVKKIFNILGFNDNQEIMIHKKIKKIYVEFIKNLTSYKNVQAYMLAINIINEIPPIGDRDKKIFDLVKILPEYIEETITEFETIASTIIPAVIYSGEESNLSSIFDRINRQGTPLDEYEAYAAIWPSNIKYSIKNEKIVNHILAKYDKLNDDIYTVKDYDRNEIRLSKKLTLFEFVFGYSKYLNECPLLAFEKKVGVDEISKMGFELLGLCYLESKKKIGELHKEICKVDLNKLVNALDDCIKYVSSLIKPMIRFKGNKRNENSKPIYSQNQILSMVAFIFREKYDKFTLEIKDDWKSNEKKIEVRLPYHFVFDMIDGFWDQGGQKPYSVLSENKYYEEINASAWESCLNNMFENSLKRKENENKKISTPSNSDLIFLNCIYKNKFSANDQLSTEKFDVEHIATKDILKKLISKTNKDDGLPISCIANLCYLPEYVNRSKKNCTFYQDKNYLEKTDLSLEDIENKFSFTSEEDLEWIDMPYENYDDFIVLREYYLEFLKNRFIILKDEFYNSMGIDKSRITKNISHTTNNEIKKSSAHGSYDFMIPSLSKLFKSELSVIKKGIAINEQKDISVIMTYSKNYVHGNKNKYWFAYRPDKINQVSTEKIFFAFSCPNDMLTFVISKEDLDKYVHLLPKTQSEKPYYHINLIIYADKSVKWFISKHEPQEIDIKNKCIDL